jgi:FtsH-binding integral membrane protein
VYDTNRICCDDQYIDNWVLGCIDLYMDIGNILITILRLIGERRD